MGPLTRRLGIVAIASVLLIAGGIKLWATESGAVAAGALVGAGLLVLGIAIRTWIEGDGG